jgi:DNA-binding response OmpR family regulator
MKDDRDVSAPSTAPVKVLIVDDEQAFARIVGSYFERDGYDVAFAFDGPTALVEAERQAPDLVVLDVMLPGLDGVEVCRRLRGFSQRLRAHVDCPQ